MFTRLSFSFENLELPNQNRHGCGGAGLARTVINGVYDRKGRSSPLTARKDQEKKESKQTRVTERKEDRRVESRCQGGSPLSRMRREKGRERFKNVPRMDDRLKLGAIDERRCKEGENRDEKLTPGPTSGDRYSFPDQ